MSKPSAKGKKKKNVKLPSFVKTIRHKKGSYKLKRNQLCYCGSKRKYKYCCQPKIVDKETKARLVVLRVLAIKETASRKVRDNKLKARLGKISKMTISEIAIMKGWCKHVS